MKVDVTTVSASQKRLQITVPAEKVRTEYDQALRTIGRKAKMPGFRPGKTPKHILEARYGAQLREDVANTLIQRSWTEVVDGKTVEPVGRPTVDEAGDIQPSADFQFSILVEVRPDITLGTVEGVEVVFPEASVSPAEIDAAVRARLEGQARLVEVTDRGIQAGDMALVELTAKDGDDVVTTEPGVMIRTEADPYYPGIEALLLGLAVNGEATADVTFGASRIDAIKGRTLSTTVKVLSIQANEVPELTDALAEELGFEGGAAGMRAKLEKDALGARTEMARNQARANLLEALIAANPFDVPAGLVDQSFQMLMDELRLQQAYRGIDPRTVSFSDAQVRDLRIRAEFAAKAGLILDKVGKDHSITVEEADIEAKLQELADGRGQTIEAVRGYFQKDDSLAELKERLLEEKTLDWLLDRAKIVAAKPAEAAPVADAPAAVEASAGSADLSVLAGAVGAIKTAVEAGELDAHLAELLAAEQAGKARKGVVSVIEKRIADLG